MNNTGNEILDLYVAMATYIVLMAFAFTMYRAFKSWYNDTKK